MNEQSGGKQTTEHNDTTKWHKNTNTKYIYMGGACGRICTYFRNNNVNERYSSTSLRDKMKRQK
jgi:hypothetical protein